MKPDSYEVNWKEREVQEDIEEIQKMVIRETEWYFSGSKLDCELWHKVQEAKLWRPR